MILDNLTAIKGVPNPDAHKSHKKLNKKLSKASGISKYSKEMLNSLDSVRIQIEKKEYDMKYKSYFGNDSLEILSAD